VRKAKGYAWEVRFSEWLNGKRFQRTMTFQGTEYPKEADVRKAIELTVSQINSGTAGEKVDARFGAIITLYRRKFLPSESRQLELKKKLHKVFPADGALVDAFTVAREDELDEINLMLLGQRRLEIGRYLDSDGKLRLVVPLPTWDDLLLLAFDEICFCGATSVQVMRRMNALLANLGQALPRERRPPLEFWKTRLKAGIAHSFTDSDERLAASEQDRQGFGAPRRHFSG